MDLAAIKRVPRMDDSVTHRDFHSVAPFTNSLDNNDQIEFAINFADVFLLLKTSYLQAEIELDPTINAADSVKLTSNFFAFLFDECQLRLYDQTICEARSVGYLSTIKKFLTNSPGEHTSGELSGWNMSNTFTLKKGEKLNICYPLKDLLNIADDFENILVQPKLYLTLNRAKDDKNLYLASAPVATETAKIVKIKLAKLNWLIEHITLSDIEKIKIYRSIERSENFPLFYRNWEIYTNMLVSTNEKQTWTIKSASALERPRWVIVAFQQDRRENELKDVSKFDHLDMRNIRLYLNDKFWPWLNNDYEFTDKTKENSALLYLNYLLFRDYYDRGSAKVGTSIGKTQFINNCPIFIVDCRHQIENSKSTIDVKLEIEAKKAFPEKTSAYVIIVHEKRFNYDPLTNSVNKIF